MLHFSRIDKISFLMLSTFDSLLLSFKISISIKSPIGGIVHISIVAMPDGVWYENFSTVFDFDKYS